MPVHRRGRAVAVALLLALGTGFLVVSWGRITGPFGDSDEGINGAVWGAASRSLRAQGPIDSRFGGVRLDGSRYATHPPLIVAETAAAELVAGERPWATRAPAWLGALATIPLLWLLLRRLGLDDVVAAAATVAALGSHMFLVYGAMLDTMVVAFPWALAVLLEWQRSWADGTGRWPVALGLSFAAAMAGWQGLFLVGLCAAALLPRSPLRSGRGAAPYAAGGLLALALTLGWSVWVHGGLAVLGGKFTRRSGANTGVAEMVGFQVPWLSQLLGLGLVALVASVAALWDRRFRPVAAVGLTAFVLYDLVLREGSGGHQYWSYWALLPAALGFGFALDRLRPRMGPPVVAVVLVLALVVDLGQPDRAGQLIDDGKDTYRLALSVPPQAELFYVGEEYRPDDWMRYAGRRPPTLVRDSADLARIAEARPDAPVLVLGTCPRPDPTDLCRRAGTPGRPRLASAAELAGELRR